MSLCLQCARCSSQLSIANYYETENGDYCCDVCPDVEAAAAAKVSDEVTASREEDTSGGSGTSCEEDSEDEKSVADRMTLANDRPGFIFVQYLLVF